MLKLHLFPLVWSLLDSLTNAVCYSVWVFLHDLDFLLWQTLKRRENPSKPKDTPVLPTHLGNVLPAQLVAWERKASEEKAQIQRPSSLWSGPGNKFCHFSEILKLKGDFYGKEFSHSLRANPFSFPYQKLKVGWSARRLCWTPDQCLEVYKGKMKCTWFKGAGGGGGWREEGVHLQSKDNPV